MSGEEQRKMIDAARLPMLPSAKLTASGVVFNGVCVFQGFIIRTDGTNDLEAEFYDDAVHADNWKGGMKIPGANSSGGLIHPGNPIRIHTLLRVVITGTVGDGWVTVYYNPYDPSL